MQKSCSARHSILFCSQTARFHHRRHTAVTSIRSGAVLRSIQVDAMAGPRGVALSNGFAKPRWTACLFFAHKIVQVPCYFPPLGGCTGIFLYSYYNRMNPIFLRQTRAYKCTDKIGYRGDHGFQYKNFFIQWRYVTRCWVRWDNYMTSTLVQIYDVCGQVKRATS